MKKDCEKERKEETSILTTSAEKRKERGRLENAAENQINIFSNIPLSEPQRCLA